MNEYQKRDYDNLVKIVEELNALGISQFKLVELGNDANHFQIVMVDNENFHVNYQEYTKKYSFFSRKTLPYVRYETEKRIKEIMASEGIVEPQNVGVLTAKKVNAWINYISEVQARLEAKSLENVAKVTAFETEVRKLGARISKKDNYGAFHGEVVKSGIEFEFSVEDEGFISKKINISYKVGDTIENFIALSDNKYIGLEA